MSLTQEEILASYQACRDWKEIINLILKSANEGESFLWQTIGNERQQRNITKIDLRLNTNKLHIFVENTDGIDITHVLYLKLAFRQSVFKASIIQIKKSELVLSIPKDIRCRDFRNLPRKTFKSAQYYVGLRPHVSFMRSEQLTLMKTELNDITIKGMGAYISDNNSHFFAPGKLLELVDIEERSLNRPLLAMVVYQEKLRSKAENSRGLYYRIGIKMIDSIPSKNLESLT